MWFDVQSTPTHYFYFKLAIPWSAKQCVVLPPSVGRSWHTKHASSLLAISWSAIRCVILLPSVDRSLSGFHPSLVSSDKPVTRGCAQMIEFTYVSWMLINVSTKDLMVSVCTWKHSVMGMVGPRALCQGSRQAEGASLQTLHPPPLSDKHWQVSFLRNRMIVKTEYSCLFISSMKRVSG